MRQAASSRRAVSALLILLAGSPLAARAATSRVEHADEAGRAHVARLQPAGDRTALLYERDRWGARTIATSGEEISDLRILCDGPCATLAIVWAETSPRGATRWFALSNDGGASFGEPVPSRLVLPMRYGTIVPHVNEPQVPLGLQADAASRLYLVQFRTISTEAWRQGLRALGAEVLQFMPWQAHVVRMDPLTASRVEALPYVHWVGAYHPAYRLDEDVLQELASGVAGPARGYNVVALQEGRDVQERIGAEVLRVGGQVVGLASEHGGTILHAVLDVAQVVEVARSNDVLWIDETGVPQDDMDIARQFHGAVYLEGVTGYSGQGVFGEVLDGGTQTSHQDFDGIQPHPGVSVPAGDHGTCTYGIVFGNGDRDGDGEAQGTGMLPGTTGWVGYYNSINPDRKTYTAALVQAPMFCVFQSNSWGNPQTTQYTSISQEMDDIIFTHDITILNSMSNLGSQQARPEAWAKNVVSVGALYHFNTLTTTDDAWNGGASIGPASDGRIKPDIMSYYDRTYSPDREPGGYVSGSYYYGNFGGTSGATPICAGAFGLFYQMWSENLFNTNPVGTTVFEKRCHAITARSMVQNLSFLYPVGSGTGQAQRVWQGWGVPNLQNLYDNRSRVNVVDEETLLQQGQSAAYCMRIPAGTPNLRVTMSYMDLPGTTSSSQHRINDLSLVVVDPGGQTYYGNVGLTTTNLSTPGGAKDTLNVTEHVFIDAPATGDWSITVVADEVNADAHPPTPAVDADFALVVTGVACPGLDCCGNGPAAEFIGVPTTGTAPLTVDFTDLSTNGPTSWAWDFGDGGTGNVQNPSHVYTAAGSYTVSLTVTNSFGSDTETKAAYILVLGLAPTADFSGIPTSGTAPLMVDFTDLSANLPTSWAWSFGDGGTSTIQNPSHVYASPGTYDVALTATNAWGSDSETKVGYVTVTTAVTEEIVSGAGPGPSNGPVVKTWNHATPPAVQTTWSAYASPGYGANVGAVDMIGGGVSEIATAPGPGVSYGPQIRGFNGSTGAALAKVNFFAYGTLNYGAVVEGGDLDGDVHDEIVTAPGPGAVFGPHIRGWNFDGATVAPISKVNFFAYGTLRYGARTAAGDLDADSFAEIATGAGAGQVFGPHVRTFNYDGAGISAQASFFAYATGSFGVMVATGSTDADARQELVAAHGPDVTANAEVKGYDVNGATVSNAWSVTAFTTMGGAEAALGDLDADGTDALIAAPGWGTSNASLIRGFAITGTTGTPIPGLDYDAYPGQTFGTKVAVGDTGI